MNAKFSINHNHSQYLVQITETMINEVLFYKPNDGLFLNQVNLIVRLIIKGKD